MQAYVFEFDNESDLRDIAAKLMDDLDVTGEFNIKPLGEGHWRMEVNSEKDLREGTLSKLKGFRKETGVGADAKTAKDAQGMDEVHEEAAASTEE